jgi:hypothetical protein
MGSAADPVEDGNTAEIDRAGVPLGEGIGSGCPGTPEGAMGGAVPSMMPHDAQALAKVSRQLSEPGL